LIALFLLFDKTIKKALLGSLELFAGFLPKGPFAVPFAASKTAAVPHYIHNVNYHKYH